MIRIAKRILSPTAINTYLACPYKFYRRYIAKEPTRPSIHLIRGSLVHQTISDFHRMVPEALNKMPLSRVIHELLSRFEALWGDASDQIETLNLPPGRIDFFVEDSKRMLENFAVWFHEQTVNPTSSSEVKIFSPGLKLMGIIDAVYKQGDSILLVDYKTSKDTRITRDMFRQAAIYALLYQDRYKEVPEAVAIHFLTARQGLEPIQIDDAMLDYARILNESVHAKTLSEDPADYPCTCNGRCREDF